MFKKLKDKLAEEVKSSPQRIQQFAQAAQAAVTSASSSISDITNNDLFTIADNDNSQNNATRSQPSPHKQQNLFQDVSLTQSPPELVDHANEMENQRQRKLSNSSFASDVSFRLPSYETPSTYHLQSDMEVSASEADERGFSGGPATLDRVTKEQLYSAYKRTQERYNKYRNQYGDLARHYKLLERENAKARSVLVETQDKALRRISELKEQCALEQSAKAHLEKALRIEIEEKIMKIEALNTKVHLLQNNDTSNNPEKMDNENDVKLISFTAENTSKTTIEEPSLPDITSLNNKIEKMEQLLNKYKDSLKISKDKNSQLTVELQILSNEIENKYKQIQEFKNTEEHLNEANTKIQELNDANEELQNQINAHDFTKIKQLSTVEMDLQKATEEITELRSKIEVFSKKEEEYAISLAENKLSIHKELEIKEAEIKSLKDGLSASKQEVQSLKIVLDDHKNRLTVLEEEKAKLSKDCTELTTTRVRIDEMNSQLQELSKKCQTLEQLKSKADEEYKCLQLQLKQETAEKLAMIDRNVYLESRNTQLTEENTKKSAQITSLESDLQILSKDKIDASCKDESEVINLLKELNKWKEKCENLESEIQEEREELLKLQTEIEKLLANHESIQSQNAEFRSTIANWATKYSTLKQASREYKTKIAKTVKKMSQEAIELRQLISDTSNETQTIINNNKESLCLFGKDVNDLFKNSVQSLEKKIDATSAQCNKITKAYEEKQAELAASYARNSEMLSEKMELEFKITKLGEQIDTEGLALKDELLNKVNGYERALEDIKIAESENKTLHKKVKEIEIENQKMRDSLRMLESDKNTLNVIISSLEEKQKKISEELETVTRDHEESVSVINCLSKENEELKKSKAMELEASQRIHCHLENEKSEHSATAGLLQHVNIEKNELSEKLINVESKNMQLIAQIEELDELHQATKEKMIELEGVFNKSDQTEEFEKEKKNLSDEIKAAENNYIKIHSEFEDLKVRYKIAEENNTKLNSDIVRTSEDYDRKNIQMNEIEEKYEHLSEENFKLKNEKANFISNIKKLDSEINDIKKSHTEIEFEKDRLNYIIEKLESKEVEENKLNVTETKVTQTEQASVPLDNVLNINEASAMFENKWVLENKQAAMASTASLNLKTNVQEDIIEQYTALKINYDALKDDNRRLHSDIEGLQSYLTKISKENSVLNDKLREMIATSEHSMDNDQLSSDITQLKTELLKGTEKINDLLRENSLLNEENLELKDQLNSQNYSKPPEMVRSVNNNHKENENIKEKYDDLLQTSSEIKKHNMDLELINKSVSGNIVQLQEKNEKLRLSNEKLERRLDEALVSLRHLHSLTENTELEYLRNILYEYLTGTGTHSVTLAKVLAAIVKFDDMQTQMVLQKEKERQGFVSGHL
ncbi:Golgin subfamily A member 4 [Operophtera brumata]|uniref:Golgin subfamily A member 4 n=1 Tax=Operophtera brumata TaxID=104452 RepID=A0A0L7LCF4_OPEBR|nr:Golgin subfamily A member 4 [Operophtera brumata]